MKILSAIALLATAYLGFQGPGQIRPGQIRPGTGPRITPPTKPAQPKPGAKPAVETADPGTRTGRVDWSYLRIFNSAIVQGKIASVRKGEFPIGSLSGLANARNLRTVVGNAGGGAPLLRNASLRDFLPLEVSPLKANFGSIVDGQTVQKAIYLRNTPAGMVRANLVTKSPIRIVSMKVLDGRVTLLKAGEWAGSLVRTGIAEYKGPSAKTLGGQATVGSRPSIRGGGNLNPTLGAGAPGIRALRTRTEAYEAPFEVQAPEGATVRIIVEFAPKYSLNGDAVGNHSAQLNLSAGTQLATVPLTGFFQGLDVGLIVIPQSREITIVGSTKYEKHPKGGNLVESEQFFSGGVDLTVINTKGPTTLMFSLVGNPPGISVDSRIDGQSRQVPSGTSTVNLALTCRFGPGTNTVSHGLGQEVTVAYHDGIRMRELVLTLNFIPDKTTFSLRKSFEDILFDLKLAAGSDGYLTLDYDLYGTNTLPQDVGITFMLGGTPILYVGTDTYHLPELNGDNRHKVKGTLTFRNELLADNWEKLVSSPSQWRLKVFEHL